MSDEKDGLDEQGELERMHVVRARVDLAGQAWCGKPVGPWHFMSADHVVEYGAKGGGAVHACHACLDGLAAALDEMRY